MSSDWAGEFAGRSAIVVCQKGEKLSEGVAAWLRHGGVPADALEDGFVGWKKAGLPLVPTARMPQLDRHGRTVWVTRSRPKVDRIACPWLIRRFVDPRAVFLFVTPAEVEGVAERFGATPFDIEGVDWGHRGELCTFDVMIEAFGLATDPLLRLATIVRGADTARLDLAPAGRRAARGLARPVADVFRRSRPARRRAPALRRLLPLVPRRDAGDPQLAHQEAGRMTTTRSSRRSAAGASLPSMREALRVWLRVAALSFGGPAGQIAVMHRILVEEKTLDLARRGSSTRSTTACCCPARRRSSSRPISAG